MVPASQLFGKSEQLSERSAPAYEPLWRSSDTRLVQPTSGRSEFLVPLQIRQSLLFLAGTYRERGKNSALPESQQGRSEVTSSGLLVLF